MFEESVSIPFMIILLLVVALVAVLFITALFGPVPSWLSFIKGLFSSYA